MNIQSSYDIQSKINTIHYPPGPLQQKIQRFKAIHCLKTNELEAIYHLVDSHVPSLRTKTLVRYEKLLKKSCDNPTLLESKQHIALKCFNADMKENVAELLNCLQEMPKEWTIIQLTPQYNPVEYLNLNNSKFYTNPIHLSVFNCGKNQFEPFLMTVGAPRDPVNKKNIELIEEMNSIIIGNKEALSSNKQQKVFRNRTEKQTYCNKRQAIEERLKSIIKDIQGLYLREWRCLLIGKYVNEDLEKQIKHGIRNFFKSGSYANISITPKTEALLNYIVKGCSFLKLKELKKAIRHCFPQFEDVVLKAVLHFVRQLNSKLELKHATKHPVILVVDESLDCLPFEMLDVLQDEPVSRVPSLHFLYTLYKEHESDMEDGHKIITQYDKGTYIVNPDMDLKNMEIRMMNFLNYWTPDWVGTAGYQPSNEECFELLTSSDIFSYNGHGNGSHLMSIDRVQRTHVKAVVLLFGCGSVKVNRLDPQVEMYGPYYMYLIARCPCIVGMLWEVTDIDTDVLTTEFISNWIPSKAPKHWEFVDKLKWKRAENIEFVQNKRIASGQAINEPELLRALSKSKKSLSYYVTKSACVVRGLPVKIKSIK